MFFYTTKPFNLFRWNELNCIPIWISSLTAEVSYLFSSVLLYFRSSKLFTFSPFAYLTTSKQRKIIRNGFCYENNIKYTQNYLWLKVRMKINQLKRHDKGQNVPHYKQIKLKYVLVSDCHVNVVLKV